MKKKKLNLVVVAHPDDEILGFGGTGASLIKNNNEIVQPIILCGKVKARSNRPKTSNLYNDMISANLHLKFKIPVLGNFPNIRMNTVDHINIVKFIEKQILKFNPNRIFTHHPTDLNDDHAQVTKACLVASRLFQRRNDLSPLEEIYFMEILSSTDWSFSSSKNPFKPDTFSDVTETIKLKLQALSKYKGVMKSPPHPRSREVLIGHAAYRGGQSGYKHAEAFETVFKRGF